MDKFEPHDPKRLVQTERTRKAQEMMGSPFNEAKRLDIIPFRILLEESVRIGVPEHGAPRQKRSCPALERSQVNIVILYPPIEQVLILSANQEAGKVLYPLGHRRTLPAPLIP